MFYRLAHPLVWLWCVGFCLFVCFNSALTSWNGNFSGTRWKQLRKSRTIMETDSVVCHLSIARFVKKQYSTKVHSELCCGLLLSSGARKCWCDISYCYNDSVVVFSDEILKAVLV